LIVVVRVADVADLEKILVIADRRRRQYASYQPQFWNPAPDALDKQRAYFGSLLDDPETLFAVSISADQVDGFIIARLVPAPPVYDPGGATCLVDDFTVNDTDSWPAAGPLLLAMVRSWAAVRGAVQLVVVTAGSDEPKRAVLRTVDLSVGSEWWVGAI
jgi:hypothetical protein